MTTYYHGTTSEALPTIAQMGLVPGKFKGADEGAMHTFIGRILGRIPPRDPSVYLGKSDVRTSFYAQLATLVHGGEPLYLKVKIPAKVSSHLKEDEQDPDAVRCECVIKPEWIDAYKVGNSTWKKFDPKELSAWSYQHETPQ